MDNYQIDLIIDRVMKEIKKQINIPSGIINNKPKCFAVCEHDQIKEKVSQKFDFDCNINDCDFAAISHMSVKGLCNAANGVNNCKAEENICDCFLSGKKLYVVNFNFDKENCNPSYARMISQNKQKLESFGAKFVSLSEFEELANTQKKNHDKNEKPSKRLYTHNDIVFIEKGSRLNVKNVILTPLAKDTARDRGITLVLED